MVMSREEQRKAFGDIEIVDDTEGGSSTNQWQTIIMQHYNNCLMEGSKEMTTGGVLKRLIDGEIVELVTPNQIMIFVYHVDMLKRALHAEIPKYPEIAKEANKFEITRRKLNISHQNAKKKIKEEFSNLSPNVNDEHGYSERALYMPVYKKRMQETHDKYYHELLYLYQESLFPCLTSLLHKKSYFSE